MEIVGQKKLLKTIDSFDRKSFPHSILLIGEKGSGKHLISQYIANKLNMSLLDVTESVSDEVISNIYCNPTSNCYLIDLDTFTEKNQNILLKFVEEPLENAFIILIAESKTSILNTIVNRCYILETNPYSKEELKSFSQDDVLLSIVRTPGKLKQFANIKAQDLIELCFKITEKIDKANLPNTLSIADKINYKDEFDKYDLDLFLDVLIKSMFSDYKETKDSRYLHYYLFTVEERKKLLDKRLNKQYFMYNYLTRLWEMSRNELPRA